MLYNDNYNHFDIKKFRKQFPILNQKDNPIVYFDNAATSLKPLAVINAVSKFYNEHTSNIHRGAHFLSELTSELFEDSRERIASFYNIKQKEVIFTYGVTHATNIICSALKLKQSDIILIPKSEHHSNILPWLNSAKVFFINIDNDGTIDLEHLSYLLNNRNVKLVCIQQASNVTGIIQPIREISSLVRKNNTLLLVDAAQGAPHILDGPNEIDCDFYLTSGHKMLAPSATGFMYVKETIAENINFPVLGGGMVNQVSLDNFEPRPLPWRFEAGTPNIEGVLGLGEAYKLLQNNKIVIEQYLEDLGNYMEKKLLEIENIHPIGFDNRETRRIKTIFSFAPRNQSIDVNQIAKMLSTTCNIICRSGSMCTHPLMSHIKRDSGVIRLSAYLYNTKSEVDYLAESISKITHIFN